MTTATQPTTVLDRAEAERLARALCDCYETLDAPDDLFARDVFLDSFPPQWRFQLQGRTALLAQLRAVSEGATVTARLIRVVPTTTGFVMEHEQAHAGEVVETARHLDLCEVRDGRIAEIVSYCNGGWDDELRARHAAEAPMLRTDEELAR
jgi:ketosteroid isomerase-like protein